MFPLGHGHGFPWGMLGAAISTKGCSPGAAPASCPTPGVLDLLRLSLHWHPAPSTQHSAPRTSSQNPTHSTRSTQQAAPSELGTQYPKPPTGPQGGAWPQTLQLMV